MNFAIPPAGSKGPSQASGWYGETIERPDQPRQHASCHVQPPFAPLTVWHCGSIVPNKQDEASRRLDQIAISSDDVTDIQNDLTRRGTRAMAESAEAVYALADLLEHLGAPWSLPEDWIILCDNDDRRHMPRAAAKRLLAKAKKETARRWLLGRFDPTEMDLELSEESEDGDGSEIFDDRALKRRAINSIDDVVSTIKSSRELYANRPIDPSQKSAHEATVAARVQYGYPADPPSQTDCFDEDVVRQCHRLINEIYSPQVKSSGSLVYLISTDNPGFVKIGFTTSLEGRLKALRTASHVEPTVHLTIPGTVSLERRLHKRFEAARHSREWFRMTEEIKAFIASDGQD